MYLYIKGVPPEYCFVTKLKGRQRGGADGFSHILREKCNGKPRVTKNRQYIYFHASVLLLRQLHVQQARFQ